MVWTEDNPYANMFFFRIICYNMSRISRYYNIRITRFHIEHNKYITWMDVEEADMYFFYGTDMSFLNKIVKDRFPNDIYDKT